MSVISSNRKKFGLLYRLNFGKYKGRTLHEIMQFDNNYISWLHSNTAWFGLDEEAREFHVYEGVTSGKMNPWEGLDAGDLC